MVVIFFPLIAVLALGLNFRSDALMSQLPGCTLAVGISIIAAVSKQIRLAKGQASVFCAPIRGNGVWQIR